MRKKWLITKYEHQLSNREFADSTFDLYLNVLLLFTFGDYLTSRRVITEYERFLFGFMYGMTWNKLIRAGGTPEILTLHSLSGYHTTAFEVQFKETWMIRGKGKGTRKSIFQPLQSELRMGADFVDFTDFSDANYLVLTDKPPFIHSFIAFVHICFSFFCSFSGSCLFAQTRTSLIWSFFSS